MPRFEYKCICDRCTVEIQAANDENDVTFNSGKYVYCESCYQDLCARWECWNSNTQTVSQKMAEAGYTRRPRGWTREGEE